MIGIVAAAYTIYGGLKAVVWSDLLQGAAIILGGVVVTVLGFREVGGVGAFFEQNAEKLHMILPAGHKTLPWTALLLGIWIPHTFYWGLNQFITQRTLAARSLREGQKGIILAASLKLIMPFIIVFPGIMAYQIFGGGLEKQDTAYPLLIREIVPAGLRGLLLAALAGAVMSSLDSMLNSASTILTIDLYKRHWRPKASTRNLVWVGRVTTALFALFACLVAPLLDNPRLGGIFNYIQMFQGFISPGIVTVFLFGIVVRRAPPAAAITALLLGVPVYGLLLWQLPKVAFLNHMAITFIVLLIAMSIITAAAPLREPRVMPVQEGFDARTSPVLWAFGGLVIAILIAFYAIFW